MAVKSHEGTEAERAQPAPKDTEVQTATGTPAAQSARDRRAYQQAIGQGLRRFYNAVASEPIPDEFLELLKKMDEEEKGGTK